MTKFTAWSLGTAVWSLASAALAGPTTPAMAADDAPAARIASSLDASAPTIDRSFADDTARTADLFADADAVSPNDPHPMIPLPPAVYAGFIGLAYVARRVLRQGRGSRG